MEKKITKVISYILQSIDSTKYMASSLSNLVNNLAEGIPKIKWNMDTKIEYVKLEELNAKINTKTSEII